MKAIYSAIMVASFLVLACAREAGAVDTLLPLRCETNGLYIHNGVSSQTIENAFGTNPLGLAFTGTTTYDFYSPPLVTAVNLTTSDKGSGTFCMQNSGPTSTNDFQVTGRMQFYDYNPLTGANTLILDSGASPQQNVKHGMTLNWNLGTATLPANFTISTGHLLHIAVIMTLVSGNPDNWGQLLYNDASGATTVADFPQKNSTMPAWPFASASNVPPTILSIGMLPNGAAQISSSGVAGGTYLVQATTNLSAGSSWVTINTNLAGTNGLFTSLDQGATNYPCRFYRLAAP